MNILLIVLNWVDKGTYWRALRFGQHLVARGHTVTLIAASGNRRIGIHLHDVNGVTLVETPDLLTGSLRSGWDPWNTLNRIAWVHNRKFDIVHAFEARPTVLFPALYLQWIRGVPLVMDWCDWFGRGGSVEERPSLLLRTALRPAETFFEETFRSRANGTTVINTILRQKAMAVGVPAERILLLPNGADVHEARPQDRFEARRRLGLPLDVQLIAYTGAIFRRDATLMAAAFDRIHQARLDTRLLLVGYCNVAMEELVQAPEAVIRTGPVSYSELIDYLAACDIGWLPLRNSGANRGRFPLKLHDFMAAGRAVVATDVGDIGDLLRRTSIGRLATDEPESVAWTVLELLSNPAEKEQMGRCARQVAEIEFAWPVVTMKLEQFYQQILNLSGAK